MLAPVSPEYLTKIPMVRVPLRNACKWEQRRSGPTDAVPRCSLRGRSGARQLAMLARKIALRAAPGGSAPLILSAARRDSGDARSGRKAGSPIEQKAGLGAQPD